MSEIAKSRNREITKFLLDPGDIVAAEADSKSAGHAVEAGLDPDDLAFARDLQLATITGVRQNQLQRQSFANFRLHLAVEEGSEGIHVAQCSDLQLVGFIDGANDCRKRVVQP